MGRTLAFILGEMEGFEQEVTLSVEDKNCSHSASCHVTSQCFVLLNLSGCRSSMLKDLLQTTTDHWLLTA